MSHQRLTIPELAIKLAGAQVHQVLDQLMYSECTGPCAYLAVAAVNFAQNRDLDLSQAFYNYFTHQLVFPEFGKSNVRICSYPGHTFVATPTEVLVNTGAWVGPSTDGCSLKDVDVNRLTLFNKAWTGLTNNYSEFLYQVAIKDDFKLDSGSFAQFVKHTPRLREEIVSSFDKDGYYEVSINQVGYEFNWFPVIKRDKQLFTSSPGFMYFSNSPDTYVSIRRLYEPR